MLSYNFHSRKFRHIWVECSQFRAVARQVGAQMRPTLKAMFGTAFSEICAARPALARIGARAVTALLAICSLGAALAQQVPATSAAFASPADLAVSGRYEARERDWRNGAIVYQVMVDRFAPSLSLQQKRHLYPAPKVLRPWTQPAQRGTYSEQWHVWTHELDFWGGDLPSVTSRLGYLQDLGVDVLYLNPIHLAYTNHKYDALDYHQISPEYGTDDDLRRLVEQLHAKGMKLVLDGVFNHMGRKSAAFERAQADPKSATRDWFYFGPQYPGGARGWYRATNLPELNLENPAVQDMVYAKPDSVVQSKLRAGVDGWRLDVAPELGAKVLADLTAAAHQARPGSLVVGEIPNYPRDWLASVDGVINFTLRDIVLNTAAGAIAAPAAARMLTRTIADAGIEPTLKSWLMLDNHDNPRLLTALPQRGQQRLAQVLQFTLPGSPNLYYGTELGMNGGEDPANRSPMRWDLVRADNPHLNWTRQLVALRRAHRALRVGDFRSVEADRLLAFERYTDRVADTVVVLVNPGRTAVTERVLMANSKLMNGGSLVDALDARAKPVRILASMATVTVPAHGFRVLVPDVAPVDGYSVYKRVQ